MTNKLTLRQQLTRKTSRVNFSAALHLEHFGFMDESLLVSWGEVVTIKLRSLCYDDSGGSEKFIGLP